MNLNEVDKPQVKKTVVVYAGRFQPFHRGHYDAYKRLVSKFGSDSVYIGTSDDQSSAKSPFGFKEKKEIATKMFGIPSSKFVKIKNPYQPNEILKTFDGKTTQYIAAVGEKDATRLQGKYFKPYKGKAGYGYDEIGYVYPVPAETNPISGTDVRKGLGSSDVEKAKKFFLKAYPKFDKDIFKMITNKLSKLNEDGFPGGVGVGLVLPGGYINGAPTGSVDETTNSVSELVQKYITDEMFNEFVSEYFGDVNEAASIAGTMDDQSFRSPYLSDWDQFDEMGTNHADIVGYTMIGHDSQHHKAKTGDIELPTKNPKEENGPAKRAIHPSKGPEYAKDKADKWEMYPYNQRPVNIYPPDVDGTMKYARNINEENSYTNEESEAEKMGLKHLGGGYYGKDDKGPATHKSDGDTIRALTPQEIDAVNKGGTAKGSSDTPAKEPKPAQPGQPVNKGATAQGKVDAAKEKPTDKKGGPATPEKTPPPPEQKLSGKELENDAEKRKEAEAKKEKETAGMSPEDKKTHEEIEHEKKGLSHDEKKAYEFLEDMPDEEKAKAIDKALEDRSFTDKFTQDTMVGGWLKKKGQQLGNFGSGIKSLFKQPKPGHYGNTEDCSGAPHGPHAKSINEIIQEDAEARRKYLASLDKDGKKKPKEEKPKDKSNCKDVHYTDYMKRDENGKPKYEEKTVPVMKTGKKPDPKNLHPGGYRKSDQALAFTNPAGTDEEPFKADELDPKTGYFKRDDKYYDENGQNVDKNGSLLDKDGKPTQDTTGFWPFKKPKTRTEKVPVYEDGLSEDQLKAAHASHHEAHEQAHAVKHTVVEVAAIAVSVLAPMYLPTLGAALGITGKAAAGAHHTVAEVAGHFLLDTAKHAGFEMLGADTATATAGGNILTHAGILEGVLLKEFIILLENENDEEANKKMVMKLLRAMLEKMKTYKMTPQQKLESIRSYKKLKAKKEKQKQKETLLNLIKENLSETKQKSINDFVDYATKRLKLQERPKVTLLSGQEYSNEQASLGGYNPETKEIYVQTENRLGADILRTIAHEMVHRKQDEMGLIKNPMEAGKDGSPIENKAHAVAGILMREYGRINKQIYTESINKKNVHNINLKLNDISLKRFQTIPTFKKLLQNDQLKNLKVGDNKLVVNNTVLGVLQRMEGPGNYKIEKLKEDINLDVDKGDTVLMGKFKNKKVQVKNIGEDPHGMPTINGKQATTFRKVDEMGRNDIHLKNIMKKYRDSSFRKRINAFLFGKPNLNNPSAVVKELIGMTYQEITDMEKKLNIPNPDLNEVSNVETSNVSDLADGTFLKKKAKRKLNTDKSEAWYDNGGYTQTDIPVADSIFGDDDAEERTIKYTIKNLPNVKYVETEFIKENLLLEGGAYGHMSHPFDDMDLTFGDLKNIISNALNGELGVVREKTDGQALAISWKKGRLIAARNKGHLANAGANAMGIEGVASKFGGRGGLTDAYNYAMKDLSAAISSLSQKQREKIFGEGSKFMNIEVIWPTSVNVIPYGQALLVFHNCIEYDINGNAIGKVDGAENILAGMIKQVNADVQSKYTIQGPPITSIPKKEDLSSKQSGYLSKLSKLQNQFGCDDSDTMAVYHQHWWENFIDKNAPVKVDKITKDALIRRWAFGDKSFRLNTITNVDLQKWAMNSDKVDVLKQQKNNIRPFEEIFLGVGADVLQFVSSVLTVHPDKAIRSMKDKLKSVAQQVRTAGSPAQIQKLKSELARLNSLGGIDRIVASEGLVFFYNGKTYKLTGTFAPLNQILGIFY